MGCISSHRHQDQYQHQHQQINKSNAVPVNIGSVNNPLAFASLQSGICFERSIMDNDGKDVNLFINEEKQVVYAKLSFKGPSILLAGTPLEINLKESTHNCVVLRGLFKGDKIKLLFMVAKWESPPTSRHGVMANTRCVMYMGDCSNNTLEFERFLYV